MDTQGAQVGNPGVLRASIGVIIRGGPLVVNTIQRTKPVLLKDMLLPAESRFVFKDPTNHSAKYVNHPVVIELFFGENAWEDYDIYLGRFEIQSFLPPYTGPRDIELKLAVSTEQVVSISLLDSEAQTHRTIGYIDISALDPSLVQTSNEKTATPDFNTVIQDFMQLVNNPQHPQRRKARRGQDLVQEITISFQAALYGGIQDIEVPGTQTCTTCHGSRTMPGKALSPCPKCQGSGWEKEGKDTSTGPVYRYVVPCSTCQGDGLVNRHPCQACQGNGWVRVNRPLTLHIPAYIDSGTVICLLQQGEPGQFGGPSGHLQVTVNVAEHAFLTRIGRELCVNLPVSARFARHGGFVRVPGLEKGTVFRLELPAGTANHAVLRVSEAQDYSLAALIETYQPALLFTQPRLGKRLQAIRDWLDGAEIEVAAGGLSLDERRATAAAPIPAGPPLEPGQASQQAEFYTRRGKLYADRGDAEHALADYNLAIELDPQYASAYDNRSGWYMGHQELEKALSDINRALELDPNNSEYIFHRGMVHHFQKHLEQALADYTKALELDPINAEVYEARGKLYAYKNDQDAALADLNTALELDPARASSYHQRGAVYRCKNKLDRAIADFTRTLELDPGNDRARHQRIQAYILQNDLENALADADKLVRMYPGNADVHYNRGNIYYLQNDFSKALADFNQALAQIPNFVYAYNGRGKVYLKQGCYQQATEDFDQSLLLQPDDAWVYYWMGQAYRGLGKKKKARDYCQKAMDLSQDPKLCDQVREFLSDLR